jgi:outer membrane protein TolC
VERTQGYPRVEGFGNLTYANPNQRFFPQQNEWNSSWDVGVRMVWTINDLGSRTATAKGTDAEIAKIQVQKQQIQDALRTEVISAYRGVEEAQLARESAARGVASAEASYDDRVRLFEAGKATSFDVLDAETTLVTARLNLVEAFVAMRMARVRLDHALGRDVDAVVKAPKKREN